MATRREKKINLLSIEVQKKCQGEMNPHKLLLPVDTAPTIPPPLSLPGTYPISAHTPCPEAVVLIQLHPFPQINEALSCLFCFLQVARVTVRLNKHILANLTKEASHTSPTSKKLKKTSG